MRLRIVLLCVVLVLMASCVSAFPLTGGNGQFNATVLGTYFEPSSHDGLPDTILLEIMFNWKGEDVERSLTVNFLALNLVDSDDKFYKGSFKDYIGGTSFGKCRLLYTFDVPSGKKIEIKRVRITPPTSRGSPFSIEWTGVPEVKDASLGMKFYTIERKQEYDSETDSLSADIKVTNSAQNEQKISPDQFVLSDQFGFQYKGGSGEDVMLLPGESMRFNLGFGGVSKLSRPLYLKHLPSNLTMDISAWT